MNDPRAAPKVAILVDRVSEAARSTGRTFGFKAMMWAAFLSLGLCVGAYTVEPLSSALGVEVVGLDLRSPLDEATVDAISALLDVSPGRRGRWGKCPWRPVGGTRPPCWTGLACAAIRRRGRCRWGMPPLVGEAVEGSVPGVLWVQISLSLYPSS